jgi:transcriptional regulator GlxA family with amidase domain
MPTSMHPPLHLASRVDAFWEHQGRGLRSRIVPDGCMDFWFDLDSGESRLVGTMSRAVIVEPRAGARFFGVRLRPGVAAEYLTETGREFVDHDAPLAEVTRSGRASLGERVAEARDHAERVAVIGEFLLGAGTRVRPSDHRVRRAVQLLRAAQNTAPVRSVAATLGLSERQLERIFQDRVGIGPKLFARVARLERALSLLDAPVRGQAALAVAAGYADEPHLIRDFRALTGVTPTDLARERHVGFVQAG